MDEASRAAEAQALAVEAGSIRPRFDLYRQAPMRSPPVRRTEPWRVRTAVSHVAASHHAAASHAGTLVAALCHAAAASAVAPRRLLRLRVAAGWLGRAAVCRAAAGFVAGSLQASQASCFSMLL